MANQDILVYCDGACSGNPGPGGWGSIVFAAGRVTELGGGEPGTTNNRMELTAAIRALMFCHSEMKKNAAEKIRVFTDSVYVIRGITQWIFGWKRRGWKNAENGDVSNQDLWQELDRAVYFLKKDFEVSISWEFVKGHAGIAGNERCDAIAVAFSKTDYVELFTGKPEQYIFDIRQIPEVRPLPDMNVKNGKSAKEAWYLSLVNGVLSVHKTWPECEAVVKGRPAKFKKVTSAEEEEEVKKSWGVS